MFCINNICWKIKFTDEYNPVFRRSNGTYTVGCTDLSTKTVYLSNKLRGDFLKRVLTHEVVHTLIYSLGLIMNTKQEEILADFIAKYAKDILKIADNALKEAESLSS